MRFFGRGVGGYSHDGMLGIYPLERPHTGGDDPQLLMESLATGIETLYNDYEIVIVDDVTRMTSRAPEEAIWELMASCRRLSDKGRTIILVARSYALGEKVVNRVKDLCHAHLNLRTETAGTKLEMLLEVRKLGDEELHTGNVFSFDVEPGVGIHNVMAKL